MCVFFGIFFRFILTDFVFGVAMVLCSELKLGFKKQHGVFDHVIGSLPKI